MKRLVIGFLAWSCVLVGCGSEDGGGGSGGAANTGGSGGTAGSGGASGGSGGASGGSGGASGGSAGSGGASGGSAGSGGASGGSAGSGGSGGATGGTGGASGGTGGATGGTGGTAGNPSAAAADEVGVFFYKKSNAANSLRWIKSNHTQRTAASYSLSGDWTSITSATKLAGAGAELIFHKATGSAPFVATALSVNNDTTTSQKTNEQFANGYGLATRRVDGKVMLLRGDTGTWVTGGWGASTWSKDYNGALTLPASTTFEHFYACVLPDMYFFYSTSDTKLYRRTYDSSAGTWGNQNEYTVSPSTLVACVGSYEPTSTNLTLMVASDGSAKLYGPTLGLVTSFTAGALGSWTHVVNLRSGLTFFYDAVSGAGGIGQFGTASPYFTLLGSFPASTFPTGMDLVTAL